MAKKDTSEPAAQAPESGPAPVETVTPTAPPAPPAAEKPQVKPVPPVFKGGKFRDPTTEAVITIVYDAGKKSWTETSVLGRHTTTTTHTTAPHAWARLQPISK